ncbi:hypothetical protein BV22DRAFT_1037702 [Leucogyrophana mollusca]|uniref:Uncharacterized protein n=1 Tax=Leucogyrophana mollusca TaxID=85980 RepID=A0ACB8BBB6_9AGAM|nr:hypothetical protein BV22DRAFT_1037702 [Leucogyrophana mollusca]
MVIFKPAVLTTIVFAVAVAATKKSKCNAKADFELGFKFTAYDADNCNGKSTSSSGYLYTSRCLCIPYGQNLCCFSSRA